MHNPIYSVVPQEELGPPKFESVQYMNPHDVTVAKELTLRLEEIFPDGFVRDDGTGIYNEESPDEKIVNTIFMADEVESRFKGEPPEQYIERYHEVQARANALRNSPNPEIAEKALKTDEALRQVDLFLRSYEAPRPNSEPQEQSIYLDENYGYMRSLYNNVVQPAFLMVGRNESNFEKIIADMAAVEAKSSIKKPTAINSIQDPLLRPGAVPSEEVLNYNNQRIRRLS